MNNDKIIIKKIDEIIIKKRIGGRECSLKIEAHKSDKGLCISTNDYVDFYRSKENLKWKDVFSEGTQMLIAGLFENTETGDVYKGTYDIMTNGFIGEVKGVIV